MIRLRGPVAAVLLASGSVAFTLFILEGVFRILHVPVGTVQINRATVRRSADSRLAFELRPASVAHAEVEYRVNAVGLRGPEVTVGKPDGVRRLAVLGDSIAFGYWVAEEDAFPRQLERLLGEIRGAGPRVEVLDFGVPGYNLDQEIEQLRAKVLDFAPDVVVVAFCLNDLEGIFSYELGLVEDRAARGQSLLGRLREELVARSMLFSWIEYRLAGFETRRSFVRARNPLSGPLYAQALGAQKAALVARFGVLKSLLAARAIPGVVAVFPAFGMRFERYPYRDLHRAVVEAAHESGLIAVDLVDCYAAYEFRDVRVDVIHPNPMGHRIAAHAIRDALCGRGLLCPGGSPPGPPCTAYRKADFPAVRGY